MRFLAMRTDWACVGVLLALVALAGPAAGQNSDDVSESDGGKLQINLDVIDLDYLRRAVEEQVPRDELLLSVEDCVTLALVNNDDILLAEFEPSKTVGDILAARGMFDPQWTTNMQYLRAEQSLGADLRTYSGGISSLDTWRTTGSSAVMGQLHWGTQYQVSLNATKEETTYSNYVEEWTGTLTLSLTQPLLRGRGKKVNTVRIKSAENAQSLAVYQLEQTIMNTVAEVVKAYWDLVGAVETLRVRQQSLDNAERLLTISQKQLDIGTAAAIEVLQAKAGVAMRQSDLIAARSSIQDAEDRLKNLLNIEDNGFLVPKRIVPTDAPRVADVDLEGLKRLEQQNRESVARAWENRPEVSMAELEIENAQLDLTLARDGVLPEFNVIGSVSQGGRDHKPREVLRGIYDRDDNSYTVGFEASIPLGNRAARGQLHRSRQTLRQAQHRLESTKNNIALQVRLALRGVSTSQILVESNRQTRRLQEANVAAEERRLQLGVTTSYRVLQIQEDLTAAQTQEVQAKTSYQKALVDKQLAEGILLENLGIDFAAPETVEPVSFIDSINPFTRD